MNLWWDVDLAVRALERRVWGGVGCAAGVVGALCFWTDRWSFFFLFLFLIIILFIIASFYFNFF